jgi:hypothetical protein
MLGIHAAPAAQKGFIAEEHVLEMPRGASSPRMAAIGATESLDRPVVRAISGEGGTPGATGWCPLFGVPMKL